MKTQNFIKTVLLATLLIFQTSCSKDKLVENQVEEKEIPSDKYTCILDGQSVSVDDPRLNETVNVLFDPQLNTYFGFSDEEKFDQFVKNHSDSDLKAKWTVAKAIREEVKKRNITEALTSEEMIDLVPISLKEKYNISKSDNSSEKPKLIGFVQLFDDSKDGLGTGCNHVFWGWGVNLTTVGFCGGGNWNDRASHVNEWFLTHGLFEHINLGGASFWVTGIGANFPLIPPFYGGLWNNRISSIL
jgi:hypothetical protein